MREIKFRGKRLSTNEWVYGYYVPYHVPGDDGLKEIPAIYNDGKGRRNDLGYWKNVDKETVGQFIGIYDSNRKEIYEGDIIEREEPFWGGRYIVEIKSVCDGVKFRLLNNHNFYLRLSDIDNENWKFHVIGNVFDNSELLRKEGKQ